MHNPHLDTFYHWGLVELCSLAFYSQHLQKQHYLFLFSQSATREVQIFALEPSVTQARLETAVYSLKCELHLP